MKNSIQRIAIITSFLMMVACSNNDDNKNTGSRNSTVAFFNYVKSSEVLTLRSDANDRNLGTVVFEEFSSVPNLKPGTWDLKAIDEGDVTDASDDTVILSNASFPVVYNYTTLQAFIGNATEDNVELVNLTMAYDDEAGDDDNDDNGIRDDEARFINISNIHPDLGKLDIYLVPPSLSSDFLSDLSVSTDPNVYKVTVDFKESSASIRLTENTNKYYLRIAKHGDLTYEEIYNSGEQTIGDYIEQTIIVAPYIGSVDTDSVLVAFYYYGNNKDFKKWPTIGSSKAQIRVLNALQDSVDLNFTISNSNSITPVDGNFHEGFEALSSYSLIDADLVSHDVSFTEGVTPLYQSDAIINGADGESKTVVIFGRTSGYPVEHIGVIDVYDEINTFTSKATITISNAAYQADINYRTPYNIHITKLNEPINASSVDVPSLGYGESTLPIPVNAGSTYKVVITEENNIVSPASSVLVSVTGGESMHFVLMEKASPNVGYQIVRVIGDASAKRTSINVSDEVATTADTITITVTAKDLGANKLIVGGDVVELDASGDAVIGGVITDNNDGTYTATITNSTEEVVTITGIINGYDIIDTATVTFNAVP